MILDIHFGHPMPDFRNSMTFVFPRFCVYMIFFVFLFFNFCTQVAISEEHVERCMQMDSHVAMTCTHTHIHARTKTIIVVVR